jgi:hypothetical protein
MSTKPTHQQLARDYGCTPRTVSRMKRAGINIYSPEEVGIHVASLRAPSLRMLCALTSLLNSAAVNCPLLAGFLQGVR